MRGQVLLPNRVDARAHLDQQPNTPRGKRVRVDHVKLELPVEVELEALPARNRSKTMRLAERRVKWFAA